MNGITTQGENMADNGGMRQAFVAYKKYVADNGPDQRLPGLQQFSPEQLFFLGFATVGIKMQEQERNMLHGENLSVKDLLLIQVVCIILVPP
jgi:predicted metalloendopeptidase